MGSWGSRMDCCRGRVDVTLNLRLPFLYHGRYLGVARFSVPARTQCQICKICKLFLNDSRRGI